MAFRWTATVLAVMLALAPITPAIALPEEAMIIEEAERNLRKSRLSNWTVISFPLSDNRNCTSES